MGAIGDPHGPLEKIIASKTLVHETQTKRALLHGHFLPHAAKDNETLVDAWFTKHPEWERLRKRRIMPRVIGLNALLLGFLDIPFEIGGRTTQHIVELMSGRSAKIHAARDR